MKTEMHFKPRGGEHGDDVILADAMGAMMLAYWMHCEIQVPDDALDEELSFLDALEERKPPAAFIGYGNYVGYWVCRNYLLLSTAYSDDLGLVTAAQARAALLAYRAYDEAGRKPMTVEIEYEAEGEEALRLFVEISGYKSIKDIRRIDLKTADPVVFGRLQDAYGIVPENAVIEDS